VTDIKTNSSAQVTLNIIGCNMTTNTFFCQGGPLASHVPFSLWAFPETPTATYYWSDSDWVCDISQSDWSCPKTSVLSAKIEQKYF